MINSYKIKNLLKGLAVVAVLYVLMLGVLSLYSWRVGRLDENSYTENGKNKAVKIEIGK